MANLRAGREVHSVGKRLHIIRADVPAEIGCNGRRVASDVLILGIRGIAAYHDTRPAIPFGLDPAGGKRYRKLVCDRGAHIGLYAGLLGVADVIDQFHDSRLGRNLRLDLTAIVVAEKGCQRCVDTTIHHPAFPTKLVADRLLGIKRRQLGQVFDDIEAARLIAARERAVQHGIVAQPARHRYAGQNLRSGLAAIGAVSFGKTNRVIVPVIAAQPQAQFPFAQVVGGVDEASKMALVAQPLLEGRQRNAAQRLRVGYVFARPYAGTSRHSRRAAQRTADLAAGIDHRVVPDQVGVHLLVVARVVHAAQPLERPLVRGREADFLGEHVHVFRPEQRKQVFLLLVQVRKAEALGGGPRRNRGDVVAVKRPGQLHHAGRGVALVQRIEACRHLVGVLEAAFVEFADPGVVGPLVLVGTNGDVRRKVVAQRAAQRHAHAGFLRCADVRVVVTGASIVSRRVRVVQVAVVGYPETEQAHRPVALAQRQVEAALHVENALVADHALDAAEHGLGVRTRADELDRAADVASAVKRALRPLQHFDALKVAEARRGIREELDIVEIKPHALGVAERSQSAHGHVGESVKAHGEIQIGHLEAHVLQALDLLPVDVGPGDHGNRFGNLQQALRALARGNHNLLDFPGGSLLCHRRARGQQRYGNSRHCGY